MSVNAKGMVIVIVCRFRFLSSLPRLRRRTRPPLGTTNLGNDELLILRGRSGWLV